MEFLTLVATRQGKLRKGGAADHEAAARAVLQDWNHGHIKYYTEPPAATGTVELVQHFAQAAMQNTAECPHVGCARQTQMSLVQQQLVFVLVAGACPSALRAYRSALRACTASLPVPPPVPICTHAHLALLLPHLRCPCTWPKAPPLLPLPLPLGFFCP